MRRAVDVFTELPIAHRVTAIAAVGVLGLALVAFLQWVSTPQYTVLYSGLDDASVSEVVDALESEGVPYRLEAGGSRVLVPRDRVYTVRATLASSGIQGEVTPEGYELLDRQGLSVSDFRQRVDYQRALEGELARTLMAMENIDFASVRLVVPEEALFREQQEEPSASVLVETATSPSAAEIEAVVALVSAAVEGLEPGGVTVADVDGTVLSAPEGSGAFPALGDRNLRATQAFEDRLASDLRTLLADVLGPGRASVVVRADLDFDELSVEEEIYNPDSTVVLREQTIDEAFTGTGAAPEGAVGVNGGEVLPGEGEYDYDRSEATREFGADRTVTREVEAPGDIERLSVAVVADDGTQTGLPVPDAAELESLVAAAVGLDAERGDTVEVSLQPFPAADAPVVAAEEPEPVWMERLPQIAGAAILLGVLVGLVLMSRSARQPKPVEVEWQAPAALPETEKPEPTLEADPELTSLQRDVLDLVERQPEDIAMLLRSWLADRREMPRGVEG